MDIQHLRVRDKKTTYLPQTGRLPPQPTVEFLLRHIDPKCLVMPAHQAYAKKIRKKKKKNSKMWPSTVIDWNS